MEKLHDSQEPDHGDLTTLWHTLKARMQSGPNNGGIVETIRLAHSLRVSNEDMNIIRDDLIQQFKRKALAVKSMQ